MTQIPDLSICIPAYDMGGDGGTFLAASFEGMKTQSFKNFEIVVSDQSESDNVAQVCAHYGHDFAITRVDNRQGQRSASANTNAALRHASGDVVKVLFQDDLLNGDTALEQTIAAFHDPVVKWLLCGSGVSYDGIKVERPMVPRLHDHIEFGVNTVSSPSVLAMRRADMLEFDENLIWLMDVDIYKRLQLAHGAPAVLDQTLTINRLHAGQVSAGVSRKLQRHELRYVRRKFADAAQNGTTASFLKRYLKALRPQRRR
jgi:glycosyltransferase involved in cell wall biosynthesis